MKIQRGYKFNHVMTHLYWCSLSMINCWSGCCLVLIRWWVCNISVLSFIKQASHFTCVPEKYFMSDSMGNFLCSRAHGYVRMEKITRGFGLNRDPETGLACRLIPKCTQWLCSCTSCAQEVHFWLIADKVLFYLKLKWCYITVLYFFQTPISTKITNVRCFPASHF